MSIVELSALFQSGVLSGLAVLIIFRMPAIWNALLSFVADTRNFHAEQDALERSSRHDIANKTAAALAELTIAIEGLKVATTNFCKYKP